MKFVIALTLILLNVNATPVLPVVLSQQKIEIIRGKKTKQGKGDDSASADQKAAQNAAKEKDLKDKSDALDEKDKQLTAKDAELKKKEEELEAKKEEDAKKAEESRKKAYEQAQRNVQDLGQSLDFLGE